MGRAPLGVGVIGAGKHGQRYINHVRNDVPALQLAALWRRDDQSGRRQADDLGVRFHSDWRELVEDPTVEAVVVVVPPTMHPAIAAAVASAGKPLLIEKPLAPTGAEAIAIRDAVRAAGIPALMAHTLRWNSMVLAVRDRLAQLGPLRALALNQRFETSTLDWLDDPAVSGGGITLHTGVHSFDLVRFLTGREVTRVVCRTAQVDTRRTEDNFTALLTLDGSDALVSVNGCRATLGRSGLIDAACAQGQLVGDHQLHLAYTTRGLERTPMDLPAPSRTVLAALESFVALIDHGTAPPARLEDGVRAVQIAEACVASARSDAPAAVAPLPA